MADDGGNPGWAPWILKFWNVFAPPKGTTPGQVRLLGVGAMLAGLVVGVLGAILYGGARSALSNDVPRFLVLPLAAGYVLFMTGVYRLVTGTPPGAESKSAVASIARVLLGLLLTAATIAGGAMLWGIVTSAASPPP
jgi:hypothetical protein